ncbi:MAG: hypothetical protein ABSF29_12655 [Tepidisphaeraceae bacterium]
MASKAKSPDKGVGDTVARLIGPTGSAIFKASFKAMFGVDCGCTARQANWNILYRYD